MELRLIRCNSTCHEYLARIGCVGWRFVSEQLVIQGVPLRQNDTLRCCYYPNNPEATGLWRYNHSQRQTSFFFIFIFRRNHGSSRSDRQPICLPDPFLLRVNTDPTGIGSAFPATPDKRNPPLRLASPISQEGRLNCEFEKSEKRRESTCRVVSVAGLPKKKAKITQPRLGWEVAAGECAERQGIHDLTQCHACGLSTGLCVLESVNPRGHQSIAVRTCPESKSRATKQVRVPKELDVQSFWITQSRNIYPVSPYHAIGRNSVMCIPTIIMHSTSTKMNKARKTQKPCTTVAILISHSDNAANFPRDESALRRGYLSVQDRSYWRSEAPWYCGRSWNFSFCINKSSLFLKYLDELKNCEHSLDRDNRFHVSLTAVSHELSRSSASRVGSSHHNNYTPGHPSNDCEGGRSGRTTCGVSSIDSSPIMMAFAEGKEITILLLLLMTTRQMHRKHPEEQDETRLADKPILTEILHLKNLILIFHEDFEVIDPGVLAPAGRSKNILSMIRKEKKTAIRSKLTKSPPAGYSKILVGSEFCHTFDWSSANVRINTVYIISPSIIWRILENEGNELIIPPLLENRSVRMTARMEENVFTAVGGRRRVDGGRRTANGGRWTADRGRRTVEVGRRTVENCMKDEQIIQIRYMKSPNVIKRAKMSMNGQEGYVALSKRNRRNAVGHGRWMFALYRVLIMVKHGPLSDHISMQDPLIDDIFQATPRSHQFNNHKRVSFPIRTKSVHSDLLLAEGDLSSCWERRDFRRAIEKRSTDTSRAELCRKPWNRRRARRNASKLKNVSEYELLRKAKERNEIIWFVEDRRRTKLPIGQILGYAASCRSPWRVTNGTFSFLQNGRSLVLEDNSTLLWRRCRTGRVQKTSASRRDVSRSSMAEKEKNRILKSRRSISVSGGTGRSKKLSETLGPYSARRLTYSDLTTRPFPFRAKMDRTQIGR
ncbi:unnamed protein product [Nesidiocoris tenuis]|uniref:Uncharacterized protein n=1 Tax=Nesidiocoris tenuis TaxID=355587 RepID=A0A6H5GNT6_9HEMI|nr:unnamed protein product [Nesidiocoris tenuis]